MALDGRPCCSAALIEGSSWSSMYGVVLLPERCHCFILAPDQDLCLVCRFLFSRVFDLRSVLSREEAGEHCCYENSYNVSHCAYCRCYTALTCPSRGRCEQRTVFACAVLDRNCSRHRSNMYEILVKNFRQKLGMG